MGDYLRVESMRFSRDGRRLLLREGARVAIIDVEQGDERLVGGEGPEGEGPLHDFVAFEDEAWVVAGEPPVLRRYALGDGACLPGVAVLEGRGAGGRLLAAPVGPPLVMWSGEVRCEVRLAGGSLVTEALPPEGWAAPIEAGRRVLLREGALSIQAAEGATPRGSGVDLAPGSTVLAGAVVLEGRSLALLISHGAAQALVVVALQSGALQHRLAVEGVRAARFAERRGHAVLLRGERGIEVLDLRFGRALKRWEEPGPVLDLAVDGAGQGLALQRPGEDGAPAIYFGNYRDVVGRGGRGVAPREASAATPAAPGAEDLVEEVAPETVALPGPLPEATEEAEGGGAGDRGGGEAAADARDGDEAVAAADRATEGSPTPRLPAPPAAPGPRSPRGPVGSRPPLPHRLPPAGAPIVAPWPPSDGSAAEASPVAPAVWPPRRGPPRPVAPPPRAAAPGGPMEARRAPWARRPLAGPPPLGAPSAAAGAPTPVSPAAAGASPPAAIDDQAQPDDEVVEPATSPVVRALDRLAARVAALASTRDHAGPPTVPTPPSRAPGTSPVRAGGGAKATLGALPLDRSGARAGGEGAAALVADGEAAGPLDDLRAHFGLSPRAVELLLLAAAPWLRPELCAHFASLGGTALGEASYALAHRLLEGSDLLDELDDAAPLRRHALLRGGRAPGGPLRVAPWLLRLLGGVPPAPLSDAALALPGRRLPPAPPRAVFAPVTEDALAEARTRARAARPGGVLVALVGSDGSGRRLAARSLGAQLGLAVREVEAAELDEAPGGALATLARLLDEAAEGATLLHLTGAGAWLAAHAAARLLGLLARFPGVALFSVARVEALPAALRQRLAVLVPFPPPDVGAREALWRLHLPPAVIERAYLDPALLARHELTGGQIRACVDRALLLAEAAGSPPSAEHFERAALVAAALTVLG